MKVRDLKTLKQYDPTILLYGPLGTGKTAFTSQAGPHGLLFDFDRGIKTASTMPDEFKELRHELEFEDFYEDNPLQGKVWAKATAYINSLSKTWAASPTARKRIVILDSFTGLIKCAKYSLLARQGHQGKTLTQQEWGILFAEMENFFDAFRGLPAIKIMTGHEMPCEDASGMITKRLLCPGKKLPMEIAGFFDDVFYTKIMKVGGKTRHILTSKGNAAVEARTRTNFRDDFDMDDGLYTLLEKLGYKVD